MSDDKANSSKSAKQEINNIESNIISHEFTFKQSQLEEFLNNYGTGSSAIQKLYEEDIRNTPAEMFDKNYQTGDSTSFQYISNQILSKKQNVDPPSSLNSSKQLNSHRSSTNRSKSKEQKAKLKQNVSLPPSMTKVQTTQKFQKQFQNLNKHIVNKTSKGLNHDLSHIDIYSYDHENKDLEVGERETLNKYFEGWFKYHLHKRDKWKRMIKYAYMLRQNKLNLMLCKWKQVIREQKVSRLKRNLIQHKVYKNTTRKCFHAIKNANCQQKSSLEALVGLMRRKALEWQLIKLEHYVLAQKVQEHSERVSRGHLQHNLQSKSFRTLFQYMLGRRQTKSNKVKAAQLRVHLQYRVHFDHLKKYVFLANQKLDSMQKVNRHLQYLYRKRMMKALHKNMVIQKNKQLNARKATQFILFRKPYIIKNYIFQGLRNYNQLRFEKKQKQQEKVEQFRRQFYFDQIKKIFKQKVQEDEQTVQRVHISRYQIKYYQMWRKYLENKIYFKHKTQRAQQKYQEKLMIKIVKSMQQFLAKKRKLQHLRDNFENKKQISRMNTILRAMQNQQQFSMIRSEKMFATLNNLQYFKQLQLSFNKLRQFSKRLRESERADAVYGNWLQKKSFGALRKYYLFKQKQFIHHQIARKFRFNRLSQKLIQSLQRCAKLEQDYKHNLRVAYLFNHRQLITKAFFGLQINYNKSLYCTQKLNKHLKHKQLKLVRLSLYMLWNYRTKQKQKHQKLAIAQIFHTNYLLHRSLAQLSDFLMPKIRQNRRQSFLINKIQQQRQRIIKHHILQVLKQKVVSNRKYRLAYDRISKQKETKLKKQVMLKLTRNIQQKQTARELNGMAQMFYQKLRMYRSIVGWKIYMGQAKNEQLKNYRVLKFWAKKVKRKTFLKIVNYVQNKKKKHLMYKQAMEDRKRKIRQYSLFKLCKVAQYWQNKQGKSHFQLDFLELQRKIYFIKWKQQIPLQITPRSTVSYRQQRAIQKPPPNSTQSSQVPLQYMSISEINLQDKNTPPKDFMASKQTKSQKDQELLNWLNTFDKPMTKLFNNSKHEPCKSSLSNNTTPFLEGHKKREEQLQQEKVMKTLNDFDSLIVRQCKQTNTHEPMGRLQSNHQLPSGGTASEKQSHASSIAQILKQPLQKASATHLSQWEQHSSHQSSLEGLDKLTEWLQKKTQRQPKTKE